MVVESNIVAQAGQAPPPGAPDEETLLRWVVDAGGVPTLPEANDLSPAPEYLERFPIGYSRTHQVLGVAVDPDDCVLVFCSYQGWRCHDTVSRLLGRNIRLAYVPAERLLPAIDRAYESTLASTEQLLTFCEDAISTALSDSTSQVEDLLDAGDGSVVKLVARILYDAVKAGASDVHLQPTETAVLVRQRIDGILFTMATLPKSIQDYLVTRLKVLGRMNVAEKKLPQDGRVTVRLGDREVDLRLSTLPTSNRERVVVRLLDRSSKLYMLEDLGMRYGTLLAFRQAIGLDHGLVLVTGPTGSGKSTTLYAALQEVATEERNVLTVEDPIEFRLPGVNQTQVNEKKGFTFAVGLRNILRQDPDIIMVGEIRDRETALMAVQASLTGHLVFSTLHTNDAASAIARLIDLGIEPYMVASSVMSVTAQRLVRTICPACRVPEDDPLALDALRGVKVPREGFRAARGRGCRECRKTGYRGRVGLFEQLVMTDAIRRLTQSGAGASEIRETACAEGMRLLRHDGLERAVAGETTVAEVNRVSASMLGYIIDRRAGLPPDAPSGG
jgi:general secretion pathway protein E